MRFLRYLLVQVLAYGLDMGGFILLFTRFGIDPLVANMVGKMMAGLFAFVAHRSFTFGVAEAGGKIQQGVRYLALLAVNIPFSALALSATLWVTSMAVAAKFLADVICVLLTYWLSKRFVFSGGDVAAINVIDHQGK
jgi:putative flippase GtrA